MQVIRLLPFTMLTFGCSPASSENPTASLAGTASTAVTTICDQVGWHATWRSPPTATVSPYRRCRIHRNGCSSPRHLLRILPRVEDVRHEDQVIDDAIDDLVIPADLAAMPQVQMVQQWFVLPTVGIVLKPLDIVQDLIRDLIGHAFAGSSA